MASKVVTLFIHFEAIQRQQPSGNLNADHIGKKVQRKFKAKKKIKTFCNELNGRFWGSNNDKIHSDAGKSLSPAAAQAPMSLQWIGQDKRLQMMLIMLLAKVFSVCFIHPWYVWLNSVWLMRCVTLHCFFFHGIGFLCVCYPVVGRSLAAQVHIMWSISFRLKTRSIHFGVWNNGDGRGRADEATGNYLLLCKRAKWNSRFEAEP